MPLPITHLFVTVLGFDFLRDITQRIRIRNRDLALLGITGILPDIDIILVPFLGWNIHKIWTHTLLVLIIFSLLMVALAWLVVKSWQGRILFGLGIIAYGVHIGLDFVMRSVPFLYPWDGGSIGFALLGSPTEYLQFSMLDSSIFGFFFLYYLVTGFASFRYAWNFPPARFWYQKEFEEGTSTIVKGWIGFIRKHPIAWRIIIKILDPAREGPHTGTKRVLVELWNPDDPQELLYGSTFYLGIGELARDAGLFIRVSSIKPSTPQDKGSVTLELLPARFTGLMELIQRLFWRPFFAFQVEKSHKGQE